jgi:hypothetical protein
MSDQEDDMRATNRIAFTSLALALAAASHMPTAFGAKVIWDIGGRHSAAKIQSACADAGGDFYQEPGNYGCENTDAGASVYCTSDGKCHAVIAERPTAAGQVKQLTFDAVFATTRR